MINVFVKNVVFGICQIAGVLIAACHVSVLGTLLEFVKMLFNTYGLYASRVVS
jgi:hypothetical protein